MDLIQGKLRQLGEQLPGQLSMPGEERYQAAMAIWAKPANRTPQAIVHCLTTRHVQLAVRAARVGDLPLSVLGGGHDWAARSLCDGLVIDLRRMNGAAVDHSGQSVRLSGGARAADIAAVADPFGLAAVTGSVGSVGMAGLTLGGGYGPLIGSFGLALDNLLAAEIVLADGRVVTAGPDQEEELFWALRGGGGNFGVVTEMQHRLHKVPSVHSGILFYSFSDAKAVLHGCTNIVASLPDELTVQLGAVVGPEGPPVVIVVPTWCGAPEQGERRLAPFLKLGTLVAGSVQATSYGVSLTAFDPYLAHGKRTFMENCSLPILDVGGVDLMIQAMATARPGCAIFTHEFRGAASRVAEGATAFGLRRDHVLIEVLAQFADRSDGPEEERYRQWAKAARHTFDAIALPGGYPKFLTAGDVERVAKSYGRNAGRLLDAKRRYDPANVFRSALPLPVSRDHDPASLRRALKIL
jgi:FAD/FMN-containing dehydrogenase